MEKKSVIIPVLFVFLLNFVSAQFYGGFTDFLYNIDPNAMILGVLFIVLFAILFFSLSRIFKDKYGYPNKTISTIVALALSVLCVYWVNRTGFDTTDFFYSIGFSEEILYIIAPLIVLAGLIFIFTRFKEKRFGKTLLLLGGLFLILSFTDLIYEKEFLTIISIIMIVVGLWLTLRKPRGLRRPAGVTGLSGRPGRRGRRGRSGERGIGGEQGLIGEAGEQGPAGRVGRGFGITSKEKMRQVKEHLKEERRAEKKQAQIEQRQQKQIAQQERLQPPPPERLPPSRQLVSPEQMNRLQEERKRKKFLKTLINKYNEIQSKNPSDPRLINILNEINRLRKEKR